MAKLSTIDKLPEEVQAEIGRLRQNGRTIDEILAHLRQLDGIQPVSRSALGRHIQGLDVVMQTMRQTRQGALALQHDAEDAPASTTARINIELAHTALFKLQMAALADETIDADTVKTLAQSLAFLGRASKSNVDVLVAAEKRAAERARREALNEAADTAVAAATEAGLSADRAAQLRRDVLGLRMPPASGGAA